jgi:hypothetical protein
MFTPLAAVASGAAWRNQEQITILQTYIRSRLHITFAAKSNNNNIQVLRCLLELISSSTDVAGGKVGGRRLSPRVGFGERAALSIDRNNQRLCMFRIKIFVYI